MSQAPARKNYLDNLRAFSILVVFIYHIFEIYSYCVEWYIRGEKLLFPSIFNPITYIWIMPLLFAVAGMSSRYALERRSTVQYAKERVHKLLIPSIFGILLVIPIYPYLAALHYTGSANYLDYFTSITDLFGADGAFTPGHLWFLIFLFVISMLFLPLMVRYKTKGKGTLGDNVPFMVIVLLALLPYIVQHDVFEVIELGGNSILEYSAYFLLGYFLLANDNILIKLEKHRFLLLGMTVLYAGITWFILDGVFYEMASWLAILAILGLSKRYLNFSGKITDYLLKSSFGVYIFHLSWIIVTAFFIFNITDVPLIQIPLILISSVILTYSTYEICRRTSATRWMFGLKR